MPVNVPDLDRSVLPRSPLTSVICQIRYDITARASEAQSARDLHAALGGQQGFLPQLEQISEASVNLSIAGGQPAVANQQLSNGWRYSSSEGHVVSVLPTHVTLEAATYEGWEKDFAPRLEEIVRAVAKHVSPVFEQRLGLRYINHITEPEVRHASEWAGSINRDFLGLAAHEDLGPNVLFARQQAIVELEDGVRATLNHGFAPDNERGGALTYLLDCDVAREGTRDFDPANIKETADSFNTYALFLFQSALEPALRKQMSQA